MELFVDILNFKIKKGFVKDRKYDLLCFPYTAFNFKQIFSKREIKKKTLSILLIARTIMYLLCIQYTTSLIFI